MSRPGYVREVARDIDRADRVAGRQRTGMRQSHTPIVPLPDSIPMLEKLPPIVPLLANVPMLETLPVIVPVLENLPELPLITAPVSVPVLVAVPVLARLPLNDPLLAKLPWVKLPLERRVDRAVVDEGAARIDREQTVAADRAGAGGSPACSV